MTTCEAAKISDLAEALGPTGAPLALRPIDLRAFSLMFGLGPALTWRRDGRLSHLAGAVRGPEGWELWFVPGPAFDGLAMRQALRIARALALNSPVRAWADPRTRAADRIVRLAGLSPVGPSAFTGFTSEEWRAGGPVRS